MAQLSELLPFLTDPNPQVRQVALQNLVGHSSKTSPHRSLFTNAYPRVKGRDGKDLDAIGALKNLCKDEPITAHDAFAALTNLSDSLIVARKIADEEFLAFLISYISDPIALLADLACMLLSNLTKLESVSAKLLNLQVPDEPIYKFLSVEEVARAGSMATGGGGVAGPAGGAPNGAEPGGSSAAQGEASADEKKKVSAMAKLLDAFEEGANKGSGSGLGEVKGEKEKEKEKREKEEKEREKETNPRKRIKRKGNCHFLASVFANITILPSGRQFFVTPLASTTSTNAEAKEEAGERRKAEYPISRIMVYTEHPEIIRRGGVISAIKNVLFVKSAHRLLIRPNPEDEDESLAETERWRGVDLLPYLLLPLCGPEEFDIDEQDALPPSCQFLPPTKIREPDSALRLMLVESLLLLCTTLRGRQSARRRGVYTVIKTAHLTEKDDKVAEPMERLVNLIQRDESEETRADKDVEDEIGAEKVPEEDNDGMDEEDEEMAIEVI